MADRVDELERARRDIGLSVTDLWLRYFTLGGEHPLPSSGDDRELEE